MNIIYLDTLFFVNFVCDYIILLCTARVSGAVIRRGNILIASVLGGVYACLCTLPSLLWFTTPIMKFTCSILLCLISFTQEARLLRCTVIFLCISMIAGGCFSAVAMPINGIQYIPIKFKSLVFVFCAIYFILSIFFRNLPETKEREYHNVTVTLCNKTINFRALRDSGNELYDPITNRPILICRTDLLRPLFQNTIIWDDDIFQQFNTMSTPQQYQGKMRLIPCRTITGNGMLLGFQPDSVLINGKSEDHIVAFSPIDFPAEAPYQALY